MSPHDFYHHLSQVSFLNAKDGLCVLEAPRRAFQAERTACAKGVRRVPGQCVREAAGGS